MLPRYDKMFVNVRNGLTETQMFGNVRNGLTKTQMFGKWFDRSHMFGRWFDRNTDEVFVRFKVQFTDIT